MAVVDGVAPAWGSAFSRWLGRSVLRLCGWTLALDLPAEPKLVIACAPHTSNWDGLFFVAAILASGVRVNWFAKDSLFRWPFGGLLVWLGGVPIRRDRAADVVSATTEIFAARERLWVGIAPEGTRARAPVWKSGFHRIARAANVPILTAYLDYGRKVVGTGPLIRASEDYDADLAALQAFYRGITPKCPANFAAEG